ncbi:hypothetical protein ACFL51_00160 [Myxococcota bacterium]
MSDREIARRIHDQGFLKDVKLHTVRQRVVTYRERHMTPVEIAATRGAPAVLEAVEKIKTGLDSIEVAQRAIEDQERHLASYDQLLDPMMEMFERIVHDPEADQESRDARLMEFVQSGALDQIGKLMSRMDKSFSEVSKAALRIAQQRDILGLSSANPEESEAVMEARISEVVMRRAPGRRDVHEVLTDPKRRKKVLNLFERVLADRGIQKAMEVKLEGGDMSQAVNARGEIVHRDSEA